jgi:arylsulfatase A-like enzyme
MQTTLPGSLPASLLVAMSLIVPAGQAQAQKKAAGNKPNVVFILADNVGYGDMGPYGGGELRGFRTPNVDQLAAQGLKLTQYLVEPACTPSRAALLTGQYSIRNGLSLVLVGETTPNTLPKNAYTMGQLFKEAGYATAVYGKWHLGSAPKSLPMAHGFDEFYGIPPNLSWDSASYVDSTVMTHSSPHTRDELVAAGPHIVEGTPDGKLKKVKPFTMEVRAEIDVELTAKSIDFMKRQVDASKPFFLYLPFSMGHGPNLPSKDFAGKSRVGQYGDKMMEGDHHVGQIMDALKNLGVEDNTILIFASDNGPSGQITQMYGNKQSPDMGNAGPFRGELGEVTEGSIRTFAFIRWPGKVAAGSSSYAMFSIMDFLPTFANIIGAKLPTDRPIDGVDQTEVLLGKSEKGSRTSLLSFVGPDLLAVRVDQWRMYFTHVFPAGTSSQIMPGMGAAQTKLMGYPKVYNIEMDPYETLNYFAYYPWILDSGLKAVNEYLATLKNHPNPPSANLTEFSGAKE